MNNKLDQLRMKINDIDIELLSLITARASTLKAVLAAKRDATTSTQKIKVYDPVREQEVINRIVEKNSSELSNQSIEAIFRTIMAECRNFQERMLNAKDNIKSISVSVQGAKGSYSEEALQKYCQQKEINDYTTVYSISSAAVLEAIASGLTTHGIVAINNTQGGLVAETIAALKEHRYNIEDSYFLKIDHSIMTLPDVDPAELKYIYSHPQALKQCTAYLKLNYPDCEQRPWADTSQAAIDLFSGALPANSAVIAHARCAAENKLAIVDSSIQDLGANNKTLFLLLTAAI